MEDYTNATISSEFETPMYVQNKTRKIIHSFPDYDYLELDSYELYTNIMIFMDFYRNKYIYVFAIVGIFGNLLTCIAILRNKKMLNSPNLYVFSLALGDIGNLFLTAFEGAFNFDLDSWKTNVISVLGMTCISANIWTTVGITVDRYIAICWPFKARKICTISRAVRINCFVWCCSAVFSFARYLSWEFRPAGIFGEIFRTVFTMDAEIIHSFFIPLLIIIFAYTCIVQTIIRSAKLRTECGSGEQKSRGLVLSVAVVIQFLVCWGCHHAIRMVIKYTYIYETEIGSIRASALLMTTKTINLLSNLVDPLIYAAVSPQFRNAFKEILCPKCIFEREGNQQPNMRG